MITITVDGNTLNEIAEKLTTILIRIHPEYTATVGEIKKGKPLPYEVEGVEPEVDAKPAKTAKKKEATKLAETVKVVTTEVPTSDITRTHIQDALTRVNSKGGVQAMRKILASFGALKISDLPLEVYPKVIEACSNHGA